MYIYIFILFCVLLLITITITYSGMAYDVDEENKTTDAYDDIVA